MRALFAALALCALCSGVAFGQASKTPHNGSMLTTPQPAATLDPNFAVNPSPADVAAGAHLFQVHCSSCHGLNMQGGPQAPPLLNVDAGDVDFELRTGRMPAFVPFLQEYDRQPQVPRPQQLQIIQYMMTRTTGDRRLPAVSVGTDLKRGRDVYAENCQQCHAATGMGNNVGYRDVAPSLMDASPQEIAEAVRMGPDVMPRFGPKIIDDHDLNQLVGYVEWLQNAEYNPGGLRLANWGPISEGFMAWTFGIGLLVLLVRRIGTVE